MSEIKENDFCRIIRSKSGNQVLVVKDFDEEEEKDSIIITVTLPDTPGFHLKGTLSSTFESATERDEFFNLLTEERVTILENKVLEAYNSLIEQEEEEQEEQA